MANESNESGDGSSERGFTIVDRRSGAESGDAAPAASEDSAKSAPDAGAAGKAGKSQDALPAIDFATFALSLGTSALYHLGLVADPESGEPAPPDLPIARQTIDTLEMLQEKTRGNLVDDEEKLLESLLYELRLRCVEVSNRGRAGQTADKPAAE